MFPFPINPHDDLRCLPPTFASKDATLAHADTVSSLSKKMKDG